MDMDCPNGPDRNPHPENILPGNAGEMCTLVGILVKIHGCAKAEGDTEQDEKDWCT